MILQLGYEMKFSFGLEMYFSRYFSIMSQDIAFATFFVLSGEEVLMIFSCLITRCSSHDLLPGTRDVVLITCLIQLWDEVLATILLLIVRHSSHNIPYSIMRRSSHDTPIRL